MVEDLHALFPDAPVYTSAYDPDLMPDYYRTWDIRTSFLQKLPAKKITHRLALPLYPLAFEQFDLSEYDLVISSSSAFAKGVITRPDAVHICYTHTPMRYGWSSQAYLERESMHPILRILIAPTLHKLRNWDVIASMRVDRHIANSGIVAKRIAKYYRRDSDIVYPPVETHRFNISEVVGDYYLIVARFAPYKRLDLAIKACNRLNRRLIVAGSGRQEQDLRAIAGPTVEFMGRVSDNALCKLMAECKAYLMPGQEDFGITPVEVNACGRPVIAYGAGGALDSQIDGVTGVLFYEQTEDSLAEAILKSEEINFSPQRIREQSLKFDTTVFQKEILRIITEQQSSRMISQTVKNFELMI